MATSIDKIASYAVENGLANVLTDQPMSKYTSLKIGGPCDLLLDVKDADALAELFSLCRREKVPVLLIGNGTNLLFDDAGFRGVVIKTPGAGKVTVDTENHMLICDSGVSLARAATMAAKAGLSGLEFAHGIPGTVGGAIYMNAGAYGGEMADVVIETECIDGDGNIFKLCGREHDFSYRHSAFMDMDCCILRAKIELMYGDKDQIKYKMESLAQMRREKQPLEYPSAGSVFRRPKGYFAAKLIEDAGLKGYSVGGAQVSEKHAGFIINTGSATCADMLALIDIIKSEVYKKFGVELECEIKYIKPC